MKKLLSLLPLSLLVPAGHAAVCLWTNTTGGRWQAATNWQPNLVPGAGDMALVTNAGTYTVVVTNDVTVAALTVGGPGAPTLLVDNNATLSCTNGTVTNGGVLLLSNSWVNGAFTVKAGGQWFFNAPVNTYIYSLALTNQGTVTWNSGGMNVGGTTIYNSGLWLINGSSSTSYGGGGLTVWYNFGTVRRTTLAGSGTSGISGFSFVNQPGAVVELQAGTLNISGGVTNLLGGLFTNAAATTLNLSGGTWTDAGGLCAGAGVSYFNSGTFNLRTNAPPGLKFASGDVWITGTNSFQQAGAITNLTLDGANLRGTNTVAGVLTITTGSIPEKLIILPTGQLVANGGGNKLLYGLTLINQGTVQCNAGLSVGNTVVSNGGLWQITGDYSLAYGGGTIPVWTNAGILRKSGGTSISQVDGTFVNLPSGLVDAQSGRLVLATGTASQFGGTFNATGFIDLNNSTWTDAGGVTSGPGTNRFLGGTLNLRTNAIAGLLLMGGTVNITGTNTFQNAGAITNLTLDGATLAGTNTVSGGKLTVNGGAVNGRLTVQVDGQLLFGGTASKFLDGLQLFNLGSVVLNGSGVTTGNTTISNGGLWQITGDYGLSFGGVGNPVFTNSGTFEKTAGTGLGANTSVPFYNQPGGLVQVDSGTLQLPSTSTNYFGTLRLNGGTLSANGPLNVAGATLSGSGTCAATAFTGGTVSPGNAGPGLLSFSSSLNLNSNLTLVIDGTGPVPGTMYDQLSVTGTVALSNCTLQVTAMPAVPAGTTFTLIANDGTDPVSGTFNGLPENAPLTVGSQTFRIHYAGGTGNDVTLVRDGKLVGPTLGTSGGFANGSWTFTGSNAIPLLTFTVRATTNFVTWTNIGFATSTVSGTLTFTDTNAWRYTRRFYNLTN